jgi:hypothetical protein
MYRWLILSSLGLTLGCTTSAPDAGPHAEIATFTDDGKELPADSKMARLAETDPMAFLEACIARYDREVKGYWCTLIKQERINGELHKPEETRVGFREEPFSVLMEWRKNENKAKRVLYVKGENKDMIIALPAGLAALSGLWERPVDGAEARASSRYPINEFGIRLGMLRTLAPWRAAAKRGTLHIVYVGEQKVPELDGRLCYVLKRIDYEKPEDDGITEATYFFDKETWLQTGSILKGEGGKTIATYFFRDVEVNPKFDADLFARDSVKRPLK